MEHGHHAIGGVEPWQIGAGIIALACVVAIILWIVHRRTVASDGLTPMERKSLPHPQREILSMLRQCGGSMMQPQIVEALPVRLEDVTDALKELESQTLIRRQWDSEKNTFTVLAI